MKKIYILAVVAALLNTNLFAQSVSLDRGFYCNLEFVAGMSINEKNPVGEGGLNVAMGYKLNPHLTIAGGVGFNSPNIYRDNASISIPFYFRLRSDFLNKAISPYAEFDLGYNLCMPNGNIKKGERILTNTTELSYKWAEKGFSSREEWMAETGASEKDLLTFGNGSDAYLNLVDGRDSYVSDGLFARLTFGLSWKAGEHRMNFGVSAALAQYYWGTWVTDRFTNRNVKYGYVDNLAGIGDERGDTIISVGDNQFFSKFRPSLQVKLGFTF